MPFSEPPISSPDAGDTSPELREISHRHAVDTRLTLRLSPDAREALEWISAQRGNVPLSEVIRRAIGTEKFLIEMTNKGASILVEEPGRRAKELVLR